MIKHLSFAMFALIAVTSVLSEARAGHSGPKREAGKLLAVAEVFEQSCSQLGEVDENALDAQLEDLGVELSEHRNDAGLSDYMAEYLSEFAHFIDDNGIQEFCETALKTFADAEPRFLHRSKR